MADLRRRWISQINRTDAILADFSTFYRKRLKEMCELDIASTGIFQRVDGLAEKGDQGLVIKLTGNEENVQRAYTATVGARLQDLKPADLEFVLSQEPIYKATIYLLRTLSPSSKVIGLLESWGMYANHIDSFMRLMPSARYLLWLTGYDKRVIENGSVVLYKSANSEPKPIKLKHLRSSLSEPSEIFHAKSGLVDGTHAD